MTPLDAVLGALAVFLWGVIVIAALVVFVFGLALLVAVVDGIVKGVKRNRRRREINARRRVNGLPPIPKRVG